MTLHDDLLLQATQLATWDPRRPKQANLRRAVSAAYYALFHYLVHEACCAQMGAQHAQSAYRHVLGRGFGHSVMKRACVSFGGGTLKENVIRGLPSDAADHYSIPRPIQKLAATFAELQEIRHLADYDLTWRFYRSEVLTLIEQVSRHLEEFKASPTSDEKKFFLACLWAWKELAHR